MKKYSWYRVFAVTIMSSSILIFCYVLYTYSGLFADVLNSPQPRTFQMVYAFNFDNNNNFTDINGVVTPNPDVILIINITYPYGTLVAGEKITIASKAIMMTPESKNTTLIVLGYHGSYYSPNVYRDNGAPMPRAVIMNLSNEFIGSANITWPIDGDYTPFGYLIHRGLHIDLASNELPLHVFPKEELYQIQTNKVTVILSIALFFFSLFGAIDIGLRLWSSGHNPDSQNKSDATENESKPESHTDNG